MKNIFAETSFTVGPADDAVITVRSAETLIWRDRQ